MSAVVCLARRRALASGEEARRALPAIGVGKLATFSENVGCAVASLALSGSPIAAAIAGVLSVVSVDMAMRSVSHKLRARSSV